MKTEQEIMQMVSTCNNYYGCGACPYNPEDISRFIGDRWKGGCPNCDRKLVYAMGKGYGDVSEYKNRFEVADKVLTETREKLTKAEHDRDRYKSEIERLKAETSNISKETAKEILDMLYDMGIDKETLECCRICDVNGVSLAKQICEKYDVEVEQ